MMAKLRFLKLALLILNMSTFASSSVDAMQRDDDESSQCILVQEKNSSKKYYDPKRDAYLIAEENKQQFLSDFKLRASDEPKIDSAKTFLEETLGLKINDDRDVFKGLHSSAVITYKLKHFRYSEIVRKNVTKECAGWGLRACGGKVFLELKGECKGSIFHKCIDNHKCLCHEMVALYQNAKENRVKNHVLTSQYKELYRFAKERIQENEDMKKRLKTELKLVDDYEIDLEEILDLDIRDGDDIVKKLHEFAIHHYQKGISKTVSVKLEGNTECNKPGKFYGTCGLPISDEQIMQYTISVSHTCENNHKCFCKQVNALYQALKQENEERLFLTEKYKDLYKFAKKAFTDPTLEKILEEIFIYNPSKHEAKYRKLSNKLTDNLKKNRSSMSIVLTNHDKVVKALANTDLIYIVLDFDITSQNISKIIQGINQRAIAEQLGYQSNLRFLELSHISKDEFHKVISAFAAGIQSGGETLFMDVEDTFLKAPHHSRRTLQSTVNASYPQLRVTVLN